MPKSYLSLLDKGCRIKIKNKSIILFEKLALLKHKHGIVNERRALLNRPTENRHVKRRDRQTVGKHDT